MNDELQKALQEYNQALQNFEYAEGDYIDAAILALQAARRKMSALMRDVKAGELYVEPVIIVQCVTT